MSEVFLEVNKKCPKFFSNKCLFFALYRSAWVNYPRTASLEKLFPESSVNILLGLFQQISKIASFIAINGCAGKDTSQGLPGEVTGAGFGGKCYNLAGNWGGKDVCGSVAYERDVL